MYSDPSTLMLIGRLAIAFLFLFRAATSITDWDRHVKQLTSHHVPMARVVLNFGFATMIAGGLSVAFNWHAEDGAVALIIFTALANLWYHDFWKMTEPRERTMHLYIFCNNVAVVGGLIMVMAADMPAQP